MFAEVGGFTLYWHRAVTVNVYLYPDVNTLDTDPDMTPDVIIIDDDPLSRRLFVRIVTRRGLSPLGVEDGQTALDRLATLSPHIKLIITDMLMPGMSGGQLGQVLHKDYPSIPILFVSGLNTEHFSELETLDHYHFLQKPFRPAELNAALDNILS